ncbi:DUF421 domain-containing protein [Aquincola sp. S2]|uniref:DUF421 domain-containing protein n=1 Tax=Pseudaquabacterium terrae TaxID=2732868 RepID=A0ABX2EHQ9_9BURK|nr:YetF domain-containing protein [Aquabacterium terrae]NRF68165.1 DUF421 domain-containing protein [Aquabacterium terrae]
MDTLIDLFRIETNPLEMIVRGTAMYWFLFLLFRCVLRRDVGSIAIADVLLLVLIADAAQNAMAGSYQTITDGIILVATIAAWNYAFDWASYRSAFVRKLVEPRAMPLVQNGKLMRQNLRRELITREELDSKLRAKGYERIEDVKLAQLESDGEITVLGSHGTDVPSTKKPHAQPGA